LKEDSPKTQLVKEEKVDGAAAIAVASSCGSDSKEQKEDDNIVVEAPRVEDEDVTKTTVTANVTDAKSEVVEGVALTTSTDAAVPAETEEEERVENKDNVEKATAEDEGNDDSASSTKSTEKVEIDVVEAANAKGDKDCASEDEEPAPISTKETTALAAAEDNKVKQVNERNEDLVKKAVDETDGTAAMKESVSKDMEETTPTAPEKTAAPAVGEGNKVDDVDVTEKAPAGDDGNDDSTPSTQNTEEKESDNAIEKPIPQVKEVQELEEKDEKVTPQENVTDSQSEDTVEKDVVEAIATIDLKDSASEDNEVPAPTAKEETVAPTETKEDEVKREDKPVGATVQNEGSDTPEMRTLNTEKESENDKDEDGLKRQKDQVAAATVTARAANEKIVGTSKIITKKSVSRTVITKTKTKICYL